MFTIALDRRGNTPGYERRRVLQHPYKLIKDARTGVERTDVQNVLDGDLNDYIKAFLMEQTTSSEVD